MTISTFRNIRRRLPAYTSAALVALALLTAANHATAMTITPTPGPLGTAPGVATYPNTLATWSGDGAGPSLFFSTLGVIGTKPRTVYEAPAYKQSSQWVCVTHKLYKSTFTLAFLSQPNDDWNLNSQSSPQCGWIPAAATYITDNGHDFTGLVAYYGWGVAVKITWQLPNGTFIGTKVYDYDTVSDYLCTDNPQDLPPTSGRILCQRWYSNVLGGFVAFS